MSEQSRALAELEVGVKAAAIFVAIVYAVGYSIVAIHHSMFAIAQFDPLKPKIVLTGLIFILLTAIPGIAAVRTLGLAGLTGSTGIAISAQPEHQSHLRMVLVLGFFAICTVLARYSVFLFGGFADTKPWGFSLTLGCVGLYGILGFIMRKHFDRSPRGFLLLVFLVTAGLFTVVLRYEDRKLFGMSLWFYGIGMVTLGTYGLLSDPEQRKQFEWERHFAVLATILLLYATLIYKNIVPYFGGGMPMPARIYFSGRTPFSNSDSADVLLLEESHDGYYVLKPGQEKTAYFLRRDSVSLIHFGKSEK